MRFEVKVQMKPVQQILKRHGLDEDGDVQRELTKQVFNGLTAYMPKQAGVLRGRKKHITGNAEITVFGPYAKYHYFSKVMVGLPPKVATDKPLDYSKSGNPQAVPFWDRALVAEKGKAMEADIEEYIRRRQMPND